MMKKIFNKLRKSVLIYIAIYICMLVIINLILKNFNMNYREWIYFLSLILIIMGFIIGIIQLLLKIKKKFVKINAIILFIIILIPCIFYAYIFCIFAYRPEHIVMRDGKKMVAYVNGFMDTYVEYYDYKNFFVVGNKLKINEYYGKGGFDPIKNKYGYNYPVIRTNYYDENSNIIYTENNESNKINKQTDNIENEPQDVTQKVRNSEAYFSGIIQNIDANNIYFFNSDLRKYYINKNSLNYINGRTNEKITTDDIKVGYYIDTYTYRESKVISILSNIKGEELRKELMKNFALENPLYLTISPVGINMEIINKDKAILTITFDDLLPNYNNDSRKFETKVEINSNTIIECKGRINKVEQLGDVALDIIKIKLDKNTINDEIPKATYFMSSNGN